MMVIITCVLPHSQPPPKLALENFKGCIELQSLNEDVLSLYNFEKIYHLNTTQDKPCIRSVEDFRDRSGFLKVDSWDSGFF